MTFRIESALNQPSMSHGCAGLSEGGALAILVHLREPRAMGPWENSRDANQGGAHDLAEPKASNDVAADGVVAVGGVAQCSMCCVHRT